jgi:hypothetical protein
MRYNYTPLTNLSRRLIEKFGTLYHFTRLNDVGYDPATGKPKQATCNYTANATTMSFTDAERSTEMVMQGDIKLFAEEADYQVGDVVYIDSQQYRILNTEAVQGSQQKLAFYLHLRK